MAYRILLTTFMEQNRALLQKLIVAQLVKKPRLLWNQNGVFTRSHPPLVPILNQMNPIYTLPPSFLTIDFNIIPPSTLRFSE
jgi:hypothetical protein